jgi:hypothetical protein
MHPVKQPQIPQFRQIAADRLQGYRKPSGQTVYCHTTFGTSEFQDLGLPETQYQSTVPSV